MQQYMAGYDVFPLKVPPSPNAHDQQLPVLHKHHQVIFLQPMLKISRRRQAAVSASPLLYSTISELASELPDPLSKNKQRILTWLATAMHDNAQLAIFLATSLMQRRSDAILKASEFSTAEKNELRESPMTDKATLFDQKLALETMDCARQRTTDANLQRVA